MPWRRNTGHPLIAGLLLGAVLLAALAMPGIVLLALIAGAFR